MKKDHLGEGFWKDFHKTVTDKPKSKAKTKALQNAKKMKVKHSKPFEVKKEMTLTNDWKKGRKFHFKEQN